MDEASAPPQLKKAMAIYEKAGKQLYAPDVGFNLEVADAFLEACSLVLDGQTDAVQALTKCEEKVKRLRSQ